MFQRQDTEGYGVSMKIMNITNFCKKMPFAVVTGSRLNQCLNLGLIAHVDVGIKAGLLSIESIDISDSFLFEAWSELEYVFTCWQ